MSEHAMKTTQRPALAIPSITTTYAQSGTSAKNDELGMRPMQARAFEKRGEQYLLIKSPPASGKSRALMFIALDKLHRQGLKQALIIVPERSIGASFQNTALSDFGFWADWDIEPRWNLCDSGGTEGGKVKAVKAFLQSDSRILVCTHATFRFAFNELGAEAFDDRLLAVDEFHHVSVSDGNILGTQLAELLERDKSHIVAMTGSYFRGDAEAVLSPEDEAKFETVTYTYYEQLNGYEHLKHLDIGYYFYAGAYVDEILAVLAPNEKTIVHIPNVNSRESTKDKIKEVEHIIDALGTWQGADPQTGFQLVKTDDGRLLRIADLVDDDPLKRGKVAAALADPDNKHNRDHVDIIIALGMAKEGFDWIWCEHALTIGYRSSLTEIVQIIGRTTRDAPGKERARFTNLIAEPEAEQEKVTDAVNDTLKAIAASLLMEQVLAPRFEFRAKRAGAGPTEGYDYGPEGYKEGDCNVGVDEKTGTVQVEIAGLVEPKSQEAKRICREDLNEVISSFVQDAEVVERGVFDKELMPQELTQVKMGKIIKAKYPTLDDEDQEAVRQQAIATMNLTQQAKAELDEQNTKTIVTGPTAGGDAPMEARANTAFVDGVRRYAMDVRDLDIDLIDQMNPFGEAYSILAKTMDEKSLRNIEAIIGAKRRTISPDDARDLAIRAVAFKSDRGRSPLLNSTDAWEQRIAEGATAYMRYREEGRYDG